MTFQKRASDPLPLLITIHAIRIWYNIIFKLNILWYCLIPNGITNQVGETYARPLPRTYAIFRYAPTPHSSPARWFPCLRPGLGWLLNGKPKIANYILGRGRAYILTCHQLVFALKRYNIYRFPEFVPWFCTGNMTHTWIWIWMYPGYDPTISNPWERKYTDMSVNTCCFVKKTNTTRPIRLWRSTTMRNTL